jgi:hypothetical protein
MIATLLDWMGWERLSETRNRFKRLEKLMAETQAELAAQIRANNALIRANTEQVVKGQGEVVRTITRLQELIAAGGPITQELKDAVAEHSAAVAAQTVVTQGLDDVTPDDPTTPPA